MSDLESVHAAILADPDDDLVRLAYADALEERGLAGDDARAEFIRVQVELAPMADPTIGDDGKPTMIFDGSGPRAHWRRWQELRERERELWETKIGEAWIIAAVSPLQEANLIPQNDLCKAERVPAFIYRRGFVDTARLATDQWKAHGPRLVREHPIRVVRLTDREPHNTLTHGFIWWNGNTAPSTLPRYLWCLMPKRRLGAALRATVAEAHADLSDACIRWAKSIKPPKPKRPWIKSGWSNPRARTSPGLEEIARRFGHGTS